MSNEEKEYVYVPKHIAEKIKNIEDGKEQENLIMDYLDESRKEIKNNLESLEEDLLMYRGLMVKAKQGFREAKNEQLTASYELWEEFDKELPSVRAKIDTLKNNLSPLKSDLEEIKELLSGINVYQVSELLKVLEDVSRHLSYDGDTGKLLKFLFSNYKVKK